MITGLCIRNYKGIREIENLSLGPFHVLVGPNGVGKSTFLDSIDFVRDCFIHGVSGAVELRHVSDFRDLTWMRRGEIINITLKIDLSRHNSRLSDYINVYHIEIEQNELLGAVVRREYLSKIAKQVSSEFPQNSEKGLPQNSENTKILISSNAKDNIHIIGRDDSTIFDRFNFGYAKPALMLIPQDVEMYFTSNAVRDFLLQGIRPIHLNNSGMQLPCPATRSVKMELDGTNLARVVGTQFSKKKGLGPFWAKPGSVIARWVEHLRYALPDLETIGWARRQADNAEYLLLRYQNGLEAPSWVLSDGTLRMMALTLPAFLPPDPAVYMVEEPENGVHPKALEIILRSLSSVPGAQVLLATHSPLVVQQCGVKSLLCFSRDERGTHITPGPEHPMLKEWDGTPDLGTVFAAGVLE